MTSAVSDDNVWFTPNYELITWDAEGDGERMKIAWYEQDPGGKITITLGISTKIKFLGQEFNVEGGVEREINTGDDTVGESIVEYCDGLLSNSTHDTGGGLTFQMKKND